MRRFDFKDTMTVKNNWVIVNGLEYIESNEMYECI